MTRATFTNQCISHSHLRTFRLTLAAALVSSFTSSLCAQESADTEITEVVVTGTRQLIQDQIAIKRDATAIVDGLSAADIGDLPALSIGEALESITGAASHRENGGATEISIRGLGPFLSSTVFNGREATNGSGDRSVNFSQFPSELMSKVAIYKTQDASMIEGGVAGQIQLETLKPLDYGKRRMQFDLKGNINPDQLDVEDSIAGDIGYRGTVSFVDQFELDSGGQIGISLGAQRSDISQPEQEVRSNSPTGTSNRACLADPFNAEQQDPNDPDDDTGRGFSNLSVANDDCEDFAGGGDSVNYPGDNSTGYDTRVGSDDLGKPFVIVPNERAYRQNDTSDTRDSFFGAVQFQPNEDLDINVDIQWSERVQEEDRHDIAFVNMRRNTVGVTYDSLNITDQGATTSLTTDSQIEARGETYNRTEEYIGGGFAASWDATDRLTLSTDISFSETERTEEQLLIRTQTDPRYRVAWERDSSDAGSWTIEDADVTDHSLFIDRYRARIDNDLDRTNTSNAVRFDLNYELDAGAIRAIDAGVRYSTQDYYALAGARDEYEIRNDRSNTFNGVTQSEEASEAQIAALNQACRVDFQEGNEFLESERSGDIFTTVDESGNVLNTGNSWATFDTACMVRGVASFYGAGIGSPALVPGASTIDVTEDTMAFYLQANYETALVGTPVRGKFGLRVVRTEVDSVGIRAAYEIDDSDPENLQITELEVTERVTGGGDYTELLPSFSFVADLSEDKILRGGVFRGLSRANPQDMGFSRSFDENDDPGITDLNDLISSVNASGNPAFEPLTSWNYDLSLEWYPNEDSILSAGIYYKDFKGGFENVVSNETYTVDGQQITVPVILSQTNDDTSKLKGIEVTASHTFSYLPEIWSGLGFKLSYNYADSDFEFEDSNLGVRGFTDQDGTFVQTNVGIVAPGNIPGFSRETFSGQIYYQLGDFDGSLIYKYRSEYFQPYTSNGTRLRYVGDVGVWEARLSYQLTDNFKVSLEAINIFDEPKAQYFYTSDNLGELNVYGPRVFIGLRGKF
jgi:iron complex outermembrane recepter protein